MINIYFGNPGCGKTTHAVRAAHKWKKKAQKALLCKNSRKRMKLLNKLPYDTVYGNFESTELKQSDLKDLGQWTFPPHSLVLIDEAGIVYNNRKFKSMTQDLIEWFKLHRHYRCDVYFYSQSWEDMDVTIRRLADNLYYLQRRGPFTLVRKVKKITMVDEMTHQIIDGYDFIPIWQQLLPYPFKREAFEIFLRKPYFKYFDSFSTPDTPIRE